MRLKRGLAGALAIMAIGMVSNTAFGDLGRGDRYSGGQWATRSPVLGQHGMVATAVPLASQVAIDVLKKGGSAVDAAIAANATLGLMEPVSNGIGGDLFAIVWDPKTRKLYGYNGSGHSARGRSLEAMIAKVRAVDAKLGRPMARIFPNTARCRSRCRAPSMPGARCTPSSASCRWPRISRRRSSMPSTAFP